MQAIEEDHSITEAELAKREAAKSKRKDKEANGNGNGAAVEEGIPDGRPLLMRVSLAGMFPLEAPVFDEMVRRTERGKMVQEAEELIRYPGVLRNIIPVDSPAGEAIEIKRITNDTILPLVNSLLDVDLSAIGARVEQLVNQVVRVSNFYLYLHPDQTRCTPRRVVRSRLMHRPPRPARPPRPKPANPTKTS